MLTLLHEIFSPRAGPVAGATPRLWPAEVLQPIVVQSGGNFAPAARASAALQVVMRSIAG